MFTAKKHYKHTYLFIVLCIFVSCINIHQTSVPILFTQSFNSGFPNDIYTTSAASSNDDACTPEMLGRQELYSYSNIVHKKNNFSHTYRLLLYITDIVDTIHFPSYYYLSEYLSGICEPKSTENIIYISQNLYQKITNQCIPDATYQSNVYILKINSYKNIQAVTDFIKKHDQQIKVYNPVSSTILNQTRSFGFEMIYNFSKIIFILFVLSCFIIGMFDVVIRRYQYALLLVNGFNKKQCLKLILKERINYCLLSIVLVQVSVISIFYLQYHTLASIIIERAFSVLTIVNLIILFVPCVTFIILMKINNEGNMLKTSEE